MALAPPFWSRVEKSEGCWLWTGSKTSAGYGDLNFMGHHVLAHRLAYTLEHGEIPTRFLVLHKCDVPLCVRPDHLYVGSDADNGRDRRMRMRDQRLLTHDKVRAIRRLFGSMMQSEIARKFDVAPGTISKIKLGKSYAEVV